MTVNSPALSITTSSLPSGTVGSAYSSTLAASGGTTPYTWSIASGSLPAGLSLSSSGAITGNPTTAGTSNFTAKVTDNNSQTATQALSITVNPSALSITTSSLPSGTVGTAYSTSLVATGGTTPYTWSMSTGSLPAGLSLSSTGAITGTPTTAGTANFTVQVADSGSQTSTKALSITVNPTALTITTSLLPSGTVGTTYSSTLTATGGTTPYTWSIASGSLPAGLSVDPNTGAITGTPSAAGISSFTVQVTDSSSPAQSTTQALSITINPSPSADFTVSATLATITVPVNSSGTDTITVTPSGGYTGNVSLSLSGLPRRTSSSFTVNPISIVDTNSGSSGLTISTNKRTTEGSYNLSLTATDGTLSKTINLVLVVGTPSTPDFSISASPSSQSVTAGSPTSYNVSISGSGGFSDSVTLNATGLPTGASATFGTNPVSGGSGTSTMNVTTSGSTTPGTYPITITGTSTSVTHSTTVTLTVVSPGGGGDFSLSASPGSETIRGGGTATYTISVTPASGTNPTVTFNVTGFPGGTTPSFNPPSVTGTGSTILSIPVTAGTKNGNYTLTVTGDNGQGITHSISVGLKLH